MRLIERPVIGRREWVSLPGLGIPRLLAGLETGASVSCLQASRIQTFNSNGHLMVGFGLCPHQGSKEAEISAEAPIYDVRQVVDCVGHVQEYLMIRSDISIGDQQWPVKFMLSSRGTMKFSMLIGRSVLQDRFSFVPDAFFVTGNMPGSFRQDNKVSE
mgnify:CR=1 FL=1